MKDITSIISKSLSLIFNIFMFLYKILKEIIKKTWKFIILLLTTIFGFLIIRKVKVED